jgi:TBC1 domain family member 15
MTVELDSTLAQAEVLFLSFAQLVSDLDQRKAEAEHQSQQQELRHRKPTNDAPFDEPSEPKGEELPTLSPYLRDLLLVGRRHELLPGERVSEE